MGNLCGPCFKGSGEAELITPDLQTKRQQMAEAAQRRLQEQENRGIKNPESVRRNQQKALERERMENEAGQTGNTALRWTQD
ncbi:CLUMA_CG013324, isoform A [Clunio marinus]|uniref:CLUMA_CG013324, isoform A n=1 Tax=Clunio marinus TaxID=568069 RepID=A0A1J1IKH8_9DIPT|nr:CLUMA_CG013324, isoform A [Clunio marinus]